MAATPNFSKNAFTPNSAGGAAPFSLSSPPPANPSFASPTPGGGGFNFGTPSKQGSGQKPATFGASAGTPAFGAPASTPAFGAPASTPAFGALASTPAFGAPASTPAFGSPAGTPAFGAPAAGTPAKSSFGFGSPTVGAGGAFGSAPPSTATNFSLSNMNSGKPSTFGVSSTNFNMSGGGAGLGQTSSLYGGGTGGFGQSNMSTNQAQTHIPVRYPVRVRATGSMRDLPVASQPGEPLSRQSFNHCFDLKFEQKQAMRRVNAKLNEINEKMPLVASELLNLKDEVRGAVGRHREALSEEEALLRDIRWVFHSARSVVVEERVNLREIPNPFFNELLSRLEERQEVYDQQVAKLREIVEVRRQRTYSQQLPTDGFGQRRALPASIVGDVVTSQNVHISALADKLASLHERVDYLRQQAREQATRRGEIDPFLQADREERLKQQHETRLLVEEESNANTNISNVPPVTGTTGAFGTPATGTTGAFGAPATGTTGAFGAPATGTTGAFGAPATGTTSAFGAPATGTTGAFGAPATGTTGAFGAPATGTTGAFGAPSAFGTPAATQPTVRRKNVRAIRK